MSDYVAGVTVAWSEWLHVCHTHTPC